MGCDIHVFAEYFDPETKTWKFLPAPSTGIDIWSQLQEREDTGPTYRFAADPDDPHHTQGYDHVRVWSWFHNRNYLLFATLANVRGEGDPCLKLREDWPSDLSPELALETIDHTPTWWTVRELWDHFLLLREIDADFLTCLGEMMDVARILDPEIQPEQVRVLVYFDS